MSLADKVRRRLRRGWMNYALRGVGGNDNYQRLELAYKISDPWNLQSDLERFRYERINTIIGRYWPQARSLLEIGCGEGYQSEYLQRLCPDLHGIDVSATAIERAQHRLPQAKFATGDVFSQPWGSEAGRFDLVLGCEVLYYMSDPQRAVDAMTRLGKACLVTIYAPAAHRVGPVLEAIPGVQKDWFGRREAQWLVAFWPGAKP
jgi:2-polyprenyl-3-methyl-5-hydroxy-6-metoxy-1,4-benzoquinol methylase